MKGNTLGVQSIGGEGEDDGICGIKCTPIIRNMIVNGIFSTSHPAHVFKRRLPKWHSAKIQLANKDWPLTWAEKTAKRQMNLTGYGWMTRVGDRSSDSKQGQVNQTLFFKDTHVKLPASWHLPGSSLLDLVSRAFPKAQCQHILWVTKSQLIRIYWLIKPQVYVSSVALSTSWATLHRSWATTNPWVLHHYIILHRPEVEVLWFARKPSQAQPSLLVSHSPIALLMDVCHWGSHHSPGDLLSDKELQPALPWKACDALARVVKKKHQQHRYIKRDVHISHVSKANLDLGVCHPRHMVLIADLVVAYSTQTTPLNHLIASTRAQRESHGCNNGLAAKMMRQNVVFCQPSPLTVPAKCPPPAASRATNRFFPDSFMRLFLVYKRRSISKKSEVMWNLGHWAWLPWAWACFPNALPKKKNSPIRTPNLSLSVSPGAPLIILCWGAAVSAGAVVSRAPAPGAPRSLCRSRRKKSSAPACCTKPRGMLFRRLMDCICLEHLELTACENVDWVDNEVGWILAGRWSIEKKSNKVEKDGKVLLHHCMW